MFLVHHLHSACVVGILAPLVLPVLRLYEADNDLDVGSEREVLKPQSYLCLLTEQLETLKYIGFLP